MSKAEKIPQKGHSRHVDLGIDIRPSAVINHIHRCHRKKFSERTAIYFAAVADFMVERLLLASVKFAKEKGDKSLTKEHVNQTIKTNPDFLNLYDNVMISNTTYCAPSNYNVKKETAFMKRKRAQKIYENQKKKKSQEAI